MTQNELMKTAHINMLKAFRAFLDYEILSLEPDVVEEVRLVNQPVTIDSNDEIKALKDEIASLVNELNTVQASAKSLQDELAKMKQDKIEQKARIDEQLSIKPEKKVIKKKSTDSIDIYSINYEDDKNAMFQSFEPLKVDLDVMDMEENSVSIKGEPPKEEKQLHIDGVFNNTSIGTMFPVFDKLNLDMNENVYEDNSVTISMKDPKYKNITIHKGLSK